MTEMSIRGKASFKMSVLGSLKGFTIEMFCVEEEEGILNKKSETNIMREIKERIAADTIYIATNEMI